MENQGSRDHKVKHEYARLFEQTVTEAKHLWGESGHSIRLILNQNIEIRTENTLKNYVAC
jgi:hypothetical protein